MVQQEPEKDGTPYNLYTDGLKIYTTIDSRMQRYAEESVEEHVAGYLQPIFDKEKRHQTTRPFSNQLSTKEVEKSCAVRWNRANVTSR